MLEIASEGKFLSTFQSRLSCDFLRRSVAKNSAKIVKILSPRKGGDKGVARCATVSMTR